MDAKNQQQPDDQLDHNSALQQTAIRLAWAGLAPFILLAAFGLIGFTGEQGLYQTLALHGFLIYSAVILSFLGGIHWGLIMANTMNNPQGRLVICMAPSLIAWVTVSLAPALIALAVLGLFYMLWLRYDVNAVSQQTQNRQKQSPHAQPAIQGDWYAKMRRPITFVVTGTHFLWFIALASERAVG